MGFGRWWNGWRRIAKDMYDRKHGQYIQCTHVINVLLERHHEGLGMAVTTAVVLASEVAEIFDRSLTDEKRQLIVYLFLNHELKDLKLR